MSKYIDENVVHDGIRPQLLEMHGVGGNWNLVRNYQGGVLKIVCRWSGVLQQGGQTSQSRFKLRSDQRQPYRFQQAGQSGCGRNITGGDR